MIDMSDGEARRAFSAWLRTGRLPSPRSDDGIELKFNPWHDPENGRFTFANTGRHYGWGRTGPSEARAVTRERTGPDAIPTIGVIGQSRPPRGSGSVPGRGSNSRAFEDPMTLEQSFPGLRNSPDGAMIAVADNLFDLTGPANAMTAEVLQNQARQLAVQIKAIDPRWHYDEIVPTDALGNRIETVQGLTAKVNNLRFQRAAITARVRGDYEPLQVETLRFVQQRTDDAYNQAMALLKVGRLTPRLSEREAMGNYVDQQVRRALRDNYNRFGIDSAGSGPVRVNRRENNSSDGDLTYRRPDARVKDVAFDVTLTRKTLSTAQVRRFFDADFRPSRVIIIRPRQLGADHTYAIPRPETKR